MDQEQYSKIKLIIWDLDDTFWKGTISETQVIKNEKNIKLLINAVNKGIMNSICSKNDYDTVDKKLREWNIRDFFVFPSIDWTPKGTRVKNIINTMKLREPNVLFIDDNEFNLNEVKCCCPDIMTLNASDLAYLYDFIDNSNAFKDDLEHKRLQQYKTLEIKEKAKDKISSNEEFLKQSNIRIFIDTKCKDVERIAELVARSNQLNYSKIRASVEEIKKDLSSGKFLSGAVYVKDNYGDYGLAGYYQLNKKDRVLKHFLFSCRILGMGVEQFVYQYLDYPQLEVVGPVVNNIQKDSTVDWIHICKKKRIFIDSTKEKKKNLKKVLFKGPCDLNAVLPLISGVKTDTEFGFVNKRGFYVCAFLHSEHILESEFLTEEQKQEIIDEVPFMDREDFTNKMFSPKYSIVFYSLLTDVHQGLYRHKTKGYKISFNSRNYSLTDKTMWNKYINGNYENTFKFTQEILEKFSGNYEFIGALTASEIIQNINKIRELMPKETVLVLLSGSELDADVENEEFSNHAKYYAELNQELIKNYSNSTNIRIINPAKYITDQSCLNGCTNHYSKLVYHQIAQECSNIINSVIGKNVSYTINCLSFRWWIKTIYKHIKKFLIRYKKL